MVRLLVKYKNRTIKEIALDRIDTFTIGRNDDHHLTLENYAISAKHAIIQKEGKRYVIKDTASRNGTFLNGLKVHQATLRNGDIITIGKHSLVFLDRGRPRAVAHKDGLKTASAPDDPGPDNTMFMDSEIYRQMLAQSQDSPPSLEQHFILSYLSGGSGQINLSKSRMTIGRSSECDIVVPGWLSFLAGDPAAVISKTPQHHYINSVSGWIKPKINGKTVRNPVRLKDMDVIKIGGLVIQYSLKHNHAQ